MDIWLNRHIHPRAQRQHQSGRCEDIRWSAPSNHPQGVCTPVNTGLIDLRSVTTDLRHHEVLLLCNDRRPAGSLEHVISRSFWIVPRDESTPHQRRVPRQQRSTSASVGVPHVFFAAHLYNNNVEWRAIWFHSTVFQQWSLILWPAITLLQMSLLLPSIWPHLWSPRWRMLLEASKLIFRCTWHSRALLDRVWTFMEHVP